MLLDQNEPMQQGGDSGVTESALSDASEDDIIHLPRQGTMPELQKRWRTTLSQLQQRYPSR